MPIKINKVCKHCGEPVEQDDYFGDWFHTGRADAPNDMLCDPAKPRGTSAQPSVTVVPRGKEESSGN